MKTSRRVRAYNVRAVVCYSESSRSRTQSECRHFCNSRFRQQIDQVSEEDTNTDSLDERHAVADNTSNEGNENFLFSYGQDVPGRGSYPSLAEEGCDYSMRTNRVQSWRESIQLDNVFCDCNHRGPIHRCPRCSDHFQDYEDIEPWTPSTVAFDHENSRRGAHDSRKGFMGALKWDSLWRDL